MVMWAVQCVKTSQVVPPSTHRNVPTEAAAKTPLLITITNSKCSTIVVLNQLRMLLRLIFFFRHKVWFFNVRDRKNVLPWNHVIFWIINPQTEVSNDWAMIFNSLSSVNSLHIYLNNGNKMRCPKWKYFLHQLFPTSFAHKNKRCKDQWWSLVLHW